MRILSLAHRPDLDRELGAIGADRESWPIFAAKREVLAIRLDDLSTATANILKQSALAHGADCAVSGKVASGRVRRSSAILFATPRQCSRLWPVLEHQPECVARLVPELRRLERLHRQPARTLLAGGKRLDLSGRTRVMGILNVTPDSFSDGGEFLAPEAAAERALSMAADGADFIDIGAESTRPGAAPVPAKEQLARLLPVLRRVAGRVRVPISVDTTSAAVARAAIDAGATMVNDVSGLSFDPQLGRVVAGSGAACVLMHMKGRPRTMQRNPRYRDLLAEITAALAAALGRARAAGVGEEQTVVDPGIGFGKTREQNLEILRRLSELASLGRPVLVGPSRKRFIGETLGTGPRDRLEGTLAAAVTAAANGASILRVHDVRAAVRALAVADAIAGKR